MSFILDALKKSEAERQRQAAPNTFVTPAARPRRSLPTWVLATVALLVLANLGGLMWLLLRRTPAPTANIAAGTQAAAVANDSATLPVAAAGASAGAVAAAGGGTGSVTDAGADLAARTKPLAGSEPQVSPAADETEPAQADTPEAAHIASLKRYATLGSSAPALRLDLHVYSSKPAERYALINMRKLREGDIGDDGVKVKEITRSGVVLLYRGEELLLSRD